MPMKAAQIIVAVAFDKLFIKSVTKQQLSAAIKTLLPKKDNRKLKGVEKMKLLPPLASVFITYKIVKIKKGVPLGMITINDIKKVKTF